MVMVVNVLLNMLLNICYEQFLFRCDRVSTIYLIFDEAPYDKV